MAHLKLNIAQWIQLGKKLGYIKKAQEEAREMDEPEHLNGLPMGELSNETVREYFDDPQNEWMDRDVYDRPPWERPHIKADDDEWMRDKYQKIWDFGDTVDPYGFGGDLETWSEEDWDRAWDELELDESEISFIYDRFRPPSYDDGESRISPDL